LRRKKDGELSAAFNRIYCNGATGGPAAATNYKQPFQSLYAKGFGYLQAMARNAGSLVGNNPGDASRPMLLHPKSSSKAPTMGDET
jgi:hypothetical protein